MSQLRSPILNAPMAAIAFRVTSAGVLTPLAPFNGANGADSAAELVLGTNGLFYGTTEYGGNTNLNGVNAGFGTVYRMTSGGAVTTLVSFNGANGNSPQAPLIQAGDGNFYGTTTYGGANGGGTVFKMTPTGVLTTLVAFGSLTNSP